MSSLKGIVASPNRDWFKLNYTSGAAVLLWDCSSGLNSISYWTPHLLGQKQEGETICALLRYGRRYGSHLCCKWRMHHCILSDWKTTITLTMNFVQTGVIVFLPHLLALRLWIVPSEQQPTYRPLEYLHNQCHRRYGCTVPHAPRTVSSSTMASVGTKPFREKWMNKT